MKKEMINEDLGLVLAAIREKKRNQKDVKLLFPMYLTDAMYEKEIAELELSVRANNSLRRAQYKTVGQLVENIAGSDDLRKLRQCGDKSISEIMMKLITYQFNLLKPERRNAYLRRIVELNQ